MGEKEKTLRRTMRDGNDFIETDSIVYIQLFNRYCEPIKKAVIDKKDMERCKKYKWCLHPDGYVVTCINGQHILLHHFIQNRKGSFQIQTDHKNRNKLDCRKENLRLCTDTENKHNRGMNCTNTSGFKGISFDKQKKRWAAKIEANKTIYRLGRFKDKIEAAKAYDKAALELHGEFAYLNFPVKENRI